MGEGQLVQSRPADQAGMSVEESGAAVEPCGCMFTPKREQQSPPRRPEEAASPLEGRGRPVEGLVTDQQPPAETPSRLLKLVLHLQPSGAAGYRVLLALGTEAYDPLLRFAEAASLAAALDLIPGLVAEAEAHWQTQPRYPASAKSRPARAPSTAKATPPVQATPPAVGEATEREGAASTTKPAEQPSPGPDGAGQLSLFG